MLKELLSFRDRFSGKVGAYGNFGAVIFLTIFSLTDAPTLFATMGISALLCSFLCAFFLKEPKGSFAAHHEGEAPEPSQEALPLVLDGRELGKR